MTPGAGDLGAYDEVRAKQPWVGLFDAHLASLARREYGFVPQYWLEAREQFVDVDAGRARLVIHEGGLFLLRGATLESANTVQSLLEHLSGVGVEIGVHKEAGGDGRRRACKRGWRDVAPGGCRWHELVFLLGREGRRSEWWWYWMLRLAWRLDTGRAALQRGAKGQLRINGWWPCRRLERSLHGSRFGLASTQDPASWRLPDGPVEPVISWLYLFRYQFESCIPRWSTIPPLPWRLHRRRLLNVDDPDVRGEALHRFPLPFRWRRLRHLLRLVDDGLAHVHAQGGFVYITHRHRRHRHRLLEAAIHAWTEAHHYGHKAPHPRPPRTMRRPLRDSP